MMTLFTSCIEVGLLRSVAAGGMLAAYHRVVKPAVFAAAVASSAPLTYVFGTQMWADTSNKYHQILENSLNANSGNSKCAGIVREGLDDIMLLSKSRAGRRQLSKLFSLCPDTAADVVKTQSAGFALFMVRGSASVPYSTVYVFI
jgi:hypothetical protein